MKVFPNNKKNKGKNTSTHLLRLAILFSSLIVMPAAFASKGGELSDEARVVSLSVSDLEVIRDKNMEPYSLAAVKNGRLTPIPFQFDERTESGFVYMKDAPKKIKKKDPLAGREVFFDANDELIFMFKDSGNRRKNGMAADGRLVAEIVVETYDSQPKYVYLVEGARVGSDEFYVRHSSNLGRVETDYYSLKVDPKNAFMWDEFYYDSFTGIHPRRPIDTIKLRMRSNILGAVPLTLNNKHMIARVVSEKSGPIRSTTQYKVTLTYLKGPVMKFALQIRHHEQEFTYDSRVTIPAIRRRFVSKAHTMVTMDGNELQDAEVYTSFGPTIPAVVDGAISLPEEKMIESAFREDEINWYFLNTHEGFAALVEFRIEADEDIPIGMIYEETPDRKLKPEYYPGQLPNVGFALKGTPMKGNMRIVTNTHMFSEDPDIDAKIFADYVTKVQAVKINNL